MDFRNFFYKTGLFNQNNMEGKSVIVSWLIKRFIGLIGSITLQTIWKCRLLVRKTIFLKALCVNGIWIEKNYWKKIAGKKIRPAPYTHHPQIEARVSDYLILWYI